MPDGMLLQTSLDQSSSAWARDGHHGAARDDAVAARKRLRPDALPRWPRMEVGRPTGSSQRAPRSQWPRLTL